jgi:hypothetical protein
LWRLDEAEPEFTFAVNFIGRTLQLKPDFAEAHLLAGKYFAAAESTGTRANRIRRVSAFGAER